VRRWSEPVDSPLLLFQTNCNRSLAAVEEDGDSARCDMVAQCVAAFGQPKLDLLGTHTRLYLCLYVRRWSEPVDSPLLLSKINSFWSLAAVEEDGDSVTHEMVAQCGAACGQPKLDLLGTQTTIYHRS
jgi:hypothetical protein